MYPPAATLIFVVRCTHLPLFSLVVLGLVFLRSLLGFPDVAEVDRFPALLALYTQGGRNTPALFFFSLGIREVLLCISRLERSC